MIVYNTIGLHKATQTLRSFFSQTNGHVIMCWPTRGQWRGRPSDVAARLRCYSSIAGIRVRATM